MTFICEGNPIIPLHPEKKEIYAGIVSPDPGQTIFTNNPLIIIGTGGSTLQTVEPSQCRVDSL